MRRETTGAAAVGIGVTEGIGQKAQREHDVVLSAPRSNEHRTLTPTGQEVWELLQGMMLIAHELLVLYTLASGDTREQVLQWLGEKHAES